MKKLFRFMWDMRGGRVESVFVAEQKEVDAALDKEVCFGEVLGKHSEIKGVLESDDFEVLSEDQDLITKLAVVTGNTISGYNPLSYLADKEEGDENDI